MPNLNETLKLWNSQLNSSHRNNKEYYTLVTYKQQFFYITPGINSDVIESEREKLLLFWKNLLLSKMEVIRYWIFI